MAGGQKTNLFFFIFYFLVLAKWPAFSEVPEPSLWIAQNPFLQRVAFVNFIPDVTTLITLPIKLGCREGTEPEARSLFVKKY